MPEIYVATDIETDGPVPGVYSMLSFASAAFTGDKQLVATFTRNLDVLPEAGQHPDTMRFWRDNPTAWAACREDPVDPAQAMHEYLDWLAALPGTPVFVAHPVGFDYAFVSWYLFRFTGRNPFHPAALDLTSYAMAVFDRPFAESSKHHFPPGLLDDLPHTHVALDDAIGHGAAFCNLLAYRRRHALSPR